MGISHGMCPDGFLEYPDDYIQPWNAHNGPQYVNFLCLLLDKKL